MKRDTHSIIRRPRGWFLSKSGPLARIGRVILLALWILLLPLLALVLLEGASSLVLFIHALRRPAEGMHSEYDSLLGWVNKPNVYLRDLYGPGTYLRTNAQRFRSNHPFAENVPSGRVRVICSGDSFTLGYGVDNDHTWCERLRAQDRRIETVNMGQGGYGIDQAYLWYKRDGVALDHNVHLFAFITDDFSRMKSPTFHGYGKPVLAIRNRVLTIENVPVPGRAFYAPWLTRSADAIAQLRTSDLIRRIAKRFRPANTTNLPASDSLTWQVAAKVFAQLDSINRAKNSVLVLVFLPTKNDLGEGSEAWRRRVHELSVREHIAVADLIGDFQQVPADSVDRLFIPAGTIEFIGAEGHYTAIGNAWVANRLYQHLLTVPEIASQLPRPQ
jgi:hypothetical protein